MRKVGLICATALAIGLGVPSVGVSKERLAYVIGNARFGGPALEAPAKNAVAISRALLGLGFDVIRRENTTSTQLPLGNRAARTVALYYSGRTEATEGDILLRGAQLGSALAPGWPLLETARAFRASGADQVLLFVDTCHDADDTLTDLAADALEEGIFLAMSHDPAAGCAASVDEPQSGDTNFSDRVRLALASPDLDVQTAFDQTPGQGWTRSRLMAPLVLWARQEQPETSLSADDIAMLERLPKAEQDRMRNLWQGAGLMDSTGPIIAERNVSSVQAETVIITAPTQVATAVQAVSPVTVVQGSGSTGGVRIGGRITSTTSSQVTRASAPASGGVTIFNAAESAPAPAALPTAAGLPAPYLIFGQLRPTEASFSPTETGGSVAGTALDGSTFEARQSVRSSDPELYAQLVGSGAFDPVDTSEAGVARAIQIELQRMSCYTSSIDGDFGRGSRAAVDRYFAQIGEEVPGRDPTLELFRKILLKDDVTCPVVRQAQTPRATSSGGTTRRAAQPTRRSTAPAAAPAQRPSSGGGINSNRLGTGVFR